MKTVLLVDDDQDFVESLTILLQDQGYKTHTIYDGKSAYVEVKKTKPDLIILDSRLPGEPGEWVARRLKKSKELSRIPIIMVSAHNGSRKNAIGAGADAFLAKPFAIDELLTLIEKHLPN